MLLLLFTNATLLVPIERLKLLFSERDERCFIVITTPAASWYPCNCYLTLALNCGRFTWHYTENECVKAGS